MIFITYGYKKSCGSSFFGAWADFHWKCERSFEAKFKRVLETLDFVLICVKPILKACLNAFWKRFRQNSLQWQVCPPGPIRANLHILGPNVENLLIYYTLSQILAKKINSASNILEILEMILIDTLSIFSSQNYLYFTLRENPLRPNTCDRAYLLLVHITTELYFTTGQRSMHEHFGGNNRPT